MNKNRKIVGYIRVSTEKQDLDKQRHLLLEYAHEKRLYVNEFVEIEMSSRKSKADRRIDELLEKLQEGDLLLVAELSRLGREMLQVLNIIRACFIYLTRVECASSNAHGSCLNRSASEDAELLLTI